MSTRVYIASSMSGLRGLLLSGGLTAPLRAHAVTPAVRSALADVGEEEWEYAVLGAAAQDAVRLLGPDDPPRRVVVVAEADTVVPVDEDGDSEVEVGEAVSLRRVVAVHADSEEAAADVSAAREALASSGPDSPEAETALDRCLDHELGWFATQEIGDLVGL